MLHGIILQTREDRAQKRKSRCKQSSRVRFLISISLFLFFCLFSMISNQAHQKYPTDSLSLCFLLFVYLQWATHWISPMRTHLAILLKTQIEMERKVNFDKWVWSKISFWRMSSLLFFFWTVNYTAHILEQCREKLKKRQQSITIPKR